jgi:hypothetical protein
MGLAILGVHLKLLAGLKVPILEALVVLEAGLVTWLMVSSMCVSKRERFICDLVRTEATDFVDFVDFTDFIEPTMEPAVAIMEAAIEGEAEQEG